MVMDHSTMHIGPTPSFTFDKAFDGYVGLRVTNSYNYATVGYAPISIKNNNSPPQIISVSPANTTVAVLINETQQFSISANDQDGDPVGISWFVDGEQRTSGNSFNYDPQGEDLGIHLITANASDNNPSGGNVSFSWSVPVPHARHG